MDSNHMLTATPVSQRLTDSTKVKFLDGLRGLLSKHSLQTRLTVSDTGTPVLHTSTSFKEVVRVLARVGWMVDKSNKLNKVHTHARYLVKRDGSWPFSVSISNLLGGPAGTYIYPPELSSNSEVIPASILKRLAAAFPEGRIRKTRNGTEVNLKGSRLSVSQVVSKLKSIDGRLERTQTRDPSLIVYHLPTLGCSIRIFWPKQEGMSFEGEVYRRLDVWPGFYVDSGV